MSLSPRFLSIIVGSLVVFGLLAPGAAAQPATPAVGTVIPASQCTVGPRTIESLQQLVGTPASGGASATPSLAAVGTLAGTPADPDTVEAVTTTYRQLVACLNAGDYLRIYALYTDAYVTRLLQRTGLNLNQLEATPAPNQFQTTAFVGVHDVRVLPDGRVAARVETFDPRAGRVVVDALLVKEDDRYLINQEDAVPPSAIGTPPAMAAAGTAAAGAAQPAAVTIDMVDIAFKPNAFTIPANTDVTVTLVNQGAALHNFSITDHKNPNVKNLGISVDVAPGETKTVTIDAPAGDYYFFCNQPGHEQAGMFGTMHVQ